MTPQRKDVKPFEYIEATVPFYPPGKFGSGKPLNQMQLPLAPEESIKHFVTPVDFEVKLFASEPQIKRPICMNWDERGRLWIAESVDYPNDLQPPGKGNDRISICEDTDGDGRADKFTVFADKLSIPTSFAFYKGGIIVHQAPHTLFLRDNDGDDRADEKTILFSGWSVGDTHAGPSNLNYGLDNHYYGIVGYAGFNGTIGGEKKKFATGFYRFKMPVKDKDVSGKDIKFEFLRNTNNNSWGVGMSEEGILFGSTANGNPSEYMPIANRYYESVRGWSSTVLKGIAGNAKFYPITDKVRQVDYHGRFTAAAGHALYTARTYPKQYWNRAAFVTEPTGHLAATFLLQKKGADFTSKNAWNLLASDDEWSSPIMAEVGPDGHVWVIDWYNYIVQHNPTPAGFKTGKGAAYITELRDKKHGRIYRVVYKNAKPQTALTLKDATPQKLVATLKNDNMFWRKHAQRLLIERGKLDVVPELIKLVEDENVDAIGMNPGAMHALWTLHGLGALDGMNAQATAALAKALKHESNGVVRNALLVLPRSKEGMAMLRKFQIPIHHLNEDGQIRLAALLTLAEMPLDHEAGHMIAVVLCEKANYEDRWIADACTSAAAAHDLPFLTVMAKVGELSSARIHKVLAVVAEHYARGGPAKTIGPLMEQVRDAHPATAETMVAALAKGWPKSANVVLTKDGEDRLAKLMPRLSAAGQGQLIKLAQTWGLKTFAKDSAKVVAALLATIADGKKSDEERIASAKQLIEVQSKDDKVVDQLLDLITPNLAPTLATGLIEALGESQAPKVAPALLARMPNWPPTARQAALVVLLGRPESTKKLLEAVEKGKVQLTELNLEQKQALAAHPDKGIADTAKQLLAKGGGLPSPDRLKVLEQLLPVTKQVGNAGLGKEVFKKHCATCHTHSGEGTKIGPDLTGMAVHPKEELLVQIMDPNRNVEGNYRIYTVVTNDGKVMSGLLASESVTSLELFDSQGKRHLLQRDNVDQLVASTKSLMPEGFEKLISNEELANLLEFLTQRGKYLPLPLEKVATTLSTQGMFFSKDAEMERLIFKDWSPKTFKDVPFYLVDPKDDRVPNVILLYGPQGKIPPKMPKSVKLPVNSAAKAIHLLSGVSGWGYPYSKKGTVSMLVRLHYSDGKSEDHELLNGEHFADYIKRNDVPKSEFAFALRNQQIRFLSVQPKRADTISHIEFLSGFDQTAPVVMAVTVETK